MAFMPLFGQDPNAPLPVRNVPPRAPVMPLQGQRAPGVPAAPMSAGPATRPTMPANAPAQPGEGLLSVPYAGAKGGLLSLLPQEPPARGGGILGDLNPLQAIGLALSGAGDLAGGQNNLANSLQTLLAMRELQQKSQGKPGDYLREINGQLVDLRTGQVVGDYRTPEEPKRDLFTVTDGDQIRTFIGDKGDPTTWQPVAEGDRYRPTTNTSVTVNSGQEPNPFEKADQKTVETMLGVVANARDLMPQIERIETALDAGVETGALENMSLPIRQYAAGLGWEDPGLSQQENIASAMAYIIPRMRVEGSGSSSDRDIDLFAKAAPQFKNTPTGNRLIAASFRQTLQRKQRELDLMREYYGQNNSLQGVWDYVDENLGDLYPKPKSAEEYEALPPGTVYIHPDRGFSVKR